MIPIIATSEDIIRFWREMEPNMCEFVRRSTERADLHLSWEWGPFGYEERWNGTNSQSIFPCLLSPFEPFPGHKEPKVDLVPWLRPCPRCRWQRIGVTGDWYLGCSLKTRAERERHLQETGRWSFQETGEPCDFDSCPLLIGDVDNWKVGVNLLLFEASKRFFREYFPGPWLGYQPVESSRCYHSLSALRDQIPAGLSRTRRAEVMAPSGCIHTNTT